MFNPLLLYPMTNNLYKSTKETRIVIVTILVSNIIFLLIT